MVGIAVSLCLKASSAKGPPCNQGFKLKDSVCGSFRKINYRMRSKIRFGKQKTVSEQVDWRI